MKQEEPRKPSSADVPPHHLSELAQVLHRGQAFVDWVCNPSATPRARVRLATEGLWVRPVDFEPEPVLGNWQMVPWNIIYAVTAEKQDGEGFWPSEAMLNFYCDGACLTCIAERAEGWKTLLKELPRYLSLDRADLRDLFATMEPGKKVTVYSRAPSGLPPV